MDRFEMPFSRKDIPIPSRQEYISQLVESIIFFLDKCRWKEFHFKNPGYSRKKENYGFKTRQPPPFDEDLKLLEKLMLEIPSRIVFRPVRNSHQTKLKDKKNNIRASQNVIIESDKTKNFYQLGPDQYDKLLREAVTKEYKRGRGGEVEKNQQKNNINPAFLWAICFLQHS